MLIIWDYLHPLVTKAAMSNTEFSCTQMELEFTYTKIENNGKEIPDQFHFI